jgi:ribosomal protein S27E
VRDETPTVSLARFITTHLDWCVEQPWIDEMVREVGREVRTLLARYPEAERARELTDARCQDCGRGPMIYYPPTWAHGPVTVQCEHCGAKVPEQNWEWYMKLVEEDRRTEKDAS